VIRRLIETTINGCREVTVWLPQDPGQASKSQISYPVRRLARQVLDEVG
jgi:hypothetical protein